MCHPASLPSSTPAQRLCKGFVHVLGCPAPLQAASGSAYLLSISCASRRLSFNMAERLPSALLCSAVSDSLRAATAAFTSITSAAATARGAGTISLWTKLYREGMQRKFSQNAAA